jgi:hypothetical protein
MQGSGRAIKIIDTWVGGRGSEEEEEEEGGGREAPRPIACIKREIERALIPSNLLFFSPS